MTNRPPAATPAAATAITTSLGLILVLALILGLVAPSHALAQPSAPSAAPAPHRPMVVGIHAEPPFAFKSADGEWEGIAVRLLERLQFDLDRQVTLQDVSGAEVADALAHGRIDMALIASPTAAAEPVMDFSEPYYSTRLAIAVPSNASAIDWSAVLEALFSWSFLKLILSLVVFLLAAAVAMWLCERRNNENFRHDLFGGLADGLWWATVTMTTVGYGDKTVRSRLGRAVAGVWMFTAIVAISLFTAQVASLLTLRGLSGRVQGPGDLSSAQVGALLGSTTQGELRRWLGVYSRGFDSYEDGLRALLDGDIDAFVAADPIVRFEAINRFPGRISVLSTGFAHEEFAIALPLGSPDRKPINISILRFLNSPDWPAVLREYLGDDR